MSREKIVICVSLLTGLSAVGWTYEDTGFRKDEHVHDVFIVKMVYDPNSEQRYLSYAPTRPMSQNQDMLRAEFERLGSNNMSVGIYRPTPTIAQAYSEFIESPERVAEVLKYYLEPCGPSAQWVAMMEAARAEAAEAAGPPATTCEDKIIRGAFMNVCEDDEGETIQ